MDRFFRSGRPGRVIRSLVGLVLAQVFLNVNYSTDSNYLAIFPDLDLMIKQFGRCESEIWFLKAIILLNDRFQNLNLL